MLPPEVIEAILPGAANPLPFGMREPTLAHAVALDALGFDPSSAEPVHVVASAYVLTLDGSQITLRPAEFLAAAEKWFARRRIHAFTPFAEAVRSAWNRAWAAVIPSAGGGEKGNTAGWPVELLELLVANGWDPHDVLHRHPLSRLFAVAAAIRLRMGGKFGGPDYEERLTIRRLKTHPLTETHDNG